LKSRKIRGSVLRHKNKEAMTYPEICPELSALAKHMRRESIGSRWWYPE
jgi:hypothetical protein